VYGIGALQSPARNASGDGHEQYVQKDKKRQEKVNAAISAPVREQGDATACNVTVV
jgi:hypothetical protein